MAFSQLSFVRTSSAVFHKTFDRLSSVLLGTEITLISCRQNNDTKFIFFTSYILLLEEHGMCSKLVGYNIQLKVFTT